MFLMAMQTKITVNFDVFFRKISSHYGMSRKWPIGILIALTAMAISCQKYEVIDPVSSESCITDFEYFQRRIWGPVLQAKGCFGCHSENGVARSAGVQWSLSQNNAESDFATLRGVAVRTTSGQSILRVKVTAPKTGATITHGGGNFFPDSTGADAALLSDLDEFINRSVTPTQCEARPVAYNILYGVQEYDYAQTLRRAKIALTGKVPTLDEETRVIEGGLTGMKEVLSEIMNQEDFYNRLREIFNDVFHTDNYLYDPDLNRFNQAYQVLNEDLYPNREWFAGFAASGYDVSISSTPGVINDCPAWVDESTVTDKLGCLRRKLRDYTNYGIAREPIEIMIHVVKNNLPFNQILTTPFTLVSPYSARAYGLDTTDSRIFKDSGLLENYNSNNFFSVQLQQDELNENAAGFEKKQPLVKISIPHAGILTTPVFLARYPTSGNNVNRHRSNFFFLFFLDTNILTLAQQLDAFGDEENNPTLTNPTCAVCHTVMDPVAGLFKNYRRGNYYIHESWYHDANWVRVGNFTFTQMRVPGTSEDNSLPAGRSRDALRWLGEQTGQDPRFARSVVKMIFKALTGRSPMGRPSDVDRPPGSTDEEWSTIFTRFNQVYALQNRDMQKFEADFIESGYNLKTLIQNIILSTYFRANNASSNVSGDVRLRDIGVNRLLSPEQLNRKINSVVGFSWNPGWGSDYLMNRYRFLYGGIDSRDILDRPEQPSGLMTNIQERMAIEVACRAVVDDFTLLEHTRRKLLPLVEPTYIPDLNGTQYPEARAKIKQNIKYLHRVILGEYLPDEDPELERTYQLFYLTLREARGEIEGAGWAAADSNGTTDHSDLKCTRNYGTSVPEGRRSITSDTTFAIRAWQAVVTYLLSDYRFVYE